MGSNGIGTREPYISIRFKGISKRFEMDKEEWTRNTGTPYAMPLKLFAGEDEHDHA